MSIIGIAIAAAAFLWLRLIEAKVVSKIGFEAAGTIMQINTDLEDSIVTGAVIA